MPSRPRRPIPTPAFGWVARRRKKAAEEAAAIAEAKDPASVPVSVCYSKMTSTPEQIVAIAAEECGNGPTPLLILQRLDIKACPMLTPVRATFVCGR
jgi:hypothetical protein